MDKGVTKMYNFDEITDRRGTNSLKWDIAENELPMWVADMDFRTAPEIIDALEQRVSHGIFGYTIIPDEWYEAYISWWKRRHGIEMEKERLMFCTGVIPALSSIVRKLTTPNENVLVLTPVYNTFFNSIVNNGCRALECPLDYKNGVYSINFERLEKGLSDAQTSLMIVCNPHNPTGNIWSKDELQRIGELCKKHGVNVVSDEIHCDLTDPGYEYTPFASVSELCREISITCIAPTKTFNLAGLQTSAIYVHDPHLYHKVWRGINTDEVAEPNAFAVNAAAAAFTKGESWLDELRSYLAENKRAVREFVSQHINGVRVTDSHATYLLWLDFSDICENTDELAERIRRETGLFLTAGSHYGKAGRSFMRMNIACPRAYVEDGLSRLKAGLEH